MANNGDSTGVPGKLVAWLDRLLMTLVAGEDLRVRFAIARTVTRTRSSRHSQRIAQRHDLAANSRAE
jgi:hypothetical protein